ncbi:MAG: hypothetical protein DRH30_10045 [Deltaproteobacteria bacterium]|nr:MAG: hypothetical protein DRH30_10045 [Deltaproteobacteria bacterium]
MVGPRDVKTPGYRTRSVGETLGANILSANNSGFISSVGNWVADPDNTAEWTGSEYQDLICTQADETEATREMIARISCAAANVAQNKTYQMTFTVEHNGTFDGTAVGVSLLNVATGSVDNITTVDPTTDPQTVTARITFLNDITGGIEIKTTGTAPTQNDICYIDDVFIQEVL